MPDGATPNSQSSQSPTIGAGTSSPAELDRPGPERSSPRSLWRLALRRFLNNRIALVGLFLFGILLFSAVFAPYLAPQDPLAQDIGRSFQPGFWAKAEEPTPYILGSDWLGRDVLSRLIYGGRITVLVASVAVGLASVAGITIGLVAGYYGSYLDHILMRAMDIVLAFPTIILAIAIIAILGPGISNAVIAISIIYVPAIARLTRGAVLAAKEEDYIQATRAVGSTDLRILVRHLIPNILGPTAVYIALTVASAILDTSFLGFLGLGAQPPLPEWGTMLSESRDYIILGYWWVAMFPGLAIFMTVLGVNLMGNGLRDALDPRTDESR